MEINDSDFDDKIKEGITIVDFWAEWCGPCIGYAPLFKKAAEAIPEASFYKCNVDANQNSGKKYEIMQIPTLVMFKDGKEVSRGHALDVAGMKEWLSKQ